MQIHSIFFVFFFFPFRTLKRRDGFFSWMIRNRMHAKTNRNQSRGVSLSNFTIYGKVVPLSVIPLHTLTYHLYTMDMDSPSTGQTWTAKVRRVLVKMQSTAAFHAVTQHAPNASWNHIQLFIGLGWHNPLDWPLRWRWERLQPAWSCDSPLVNRVRPEGLCNQSSPD
ncbi:hypothetical protein VTN31DRAFT_3405 [Thermomyces dupontii]|uniref:uncharacterized protein n=1 Tax=Talaromyces thermophilus TaxID=28565 RepID=UPI003743031A